MILNSVRQSLSSQDSPDSVINPNTKTTFINVLPKTLPLGPTSSIAENESLN